MALTHTLEAHLANARPRALAALLRRFRDLDVAEDALQEAMLRALKKWPATRIPSDPAAWLIRTGSNAMIDRIRRDRRFAELASDEIALMGGPRDHTEVELERAEVIDSADMRDDVLRLMFMCCHPDLGVHDQLALALKVIAGFSVEQIAAAFVIKPKAMEQRITRAKKKASAVAGRLETPTAFERTRRLEAVCLMIYLLFNEGYASSHGKSHINPEICSEAIRLARLLLSLFPAQAEVMGLLALCLLQHARHRARIGAGGELITLDAQDRTLWDREAIAEATVMIEKALRKGRPGPYQIQAAIAAVHCRAATAADADWAEIELLYGALEREMPTPVVALNHAVAISMTKGHAAALAALAPLEDDLGSYLPYHVARADFLAALGRKEEALHAFRAALSLCPNKGQEAHITQRIAALQRCLAPD
ncbi:RNA polymerase sigma factor [Oricola cellulosilytica]|uniref:Sigma-70 family RNA polymerase sigma factor n=1 Tax=Oricola cellulosilytica TaxID=1429082 RepID=A0A4R0P989_9HYPH|nr:sigma-70 family RNA polymerase sigma factor [Oricola cellulosilytica]TCD13731.1 sigma-70 family RNA polymerase sigma factor [Oricola cellulosilytica]